MARRQRRANQDSRDSPGASYRTTEHRGIELASAEPQWTIRLWLRLRARSGMGSRSRHVAHGGRKDISIRFSRVQSERKTSGVSDCKRKGITLGPGVG